MTGPTNAATIVRVVVNGDERGFGAGATLADAVATLTSARAGARGREGGATVRAGVAVAVNNDVVPRGSWSTTPLADGDQIEVLTAVQGG